MYIYFIVFNNLVSTQIIPFMWVYNLPKPKIQTVYLKWVYFIAYKFS